MRITNCRKTDLMKAALYAEDYKVVSKTGGMHVELEDMDGAVHSFYIPKDALPLRIAGTWVYYPAAPAK